MKKTLLIKSTELLDLIRIIISVKAKVGTNVLTKIVENEEITIDCIQIEVTSLTIELKCDLNKLTKHYKVEKVNNCLTSIFIELTDLTEFLSSNTSESVTEIYSIFEANIDGAFEEYLLFEIS